MFQTIDPFPGLYQSWDGFGSLAGGRHYGHTGIDYGARAGTPIPTWCAGIVVRNEWSDGNGWTLAIDIGGGLYFSSIHMLEQSPVRIGTQLELGEHHGLVGNTGTNSVGAHYHTSLSNSPGVNLGLGRLQDPWTFIQEHMVGANSVPIIKNTIITEGEEMRLVWSTDGRGWLYTSKGRVHIGTEKDYNLLFRFLTSDQTRTPFAASPEVTAFTSIAKLGKPHEFTKDELDIIYTYIMACK